MLCVRTVILPAAYLAYPSKQKSNTLEAFVGLRMRMVCKAEGFSSIVTGSATGDISPENQPHSLQQMLVCPRPKPVADQKKGWVLPCSISTDGSGMQASSK